MSLRVSRNVSEPMFLEEIPEAARNALGFIWAERVEEVIEAALESAAVPALEPAAN